jgi:hypothetical protein
MLNLAAQEVAVGIHRTFLPLSYEQFCSSYAGAKRTRYEAAQRSLLSSPIQPIDAWLQSFVKSEKNNHEAKLDGAPRLIQPRTARYNLAVGVFIKPIEHVLYSHIDELLEGILGEPTIMKSRNLRQRAMILEKKWNDFNKPVGIPLDASRFDQHVSIPLLEIEHSLYLKFFSGSDRNRLGWLLNMQLVNEGFAGELRYRVSGCRMSGDMNTALGNCVLMCLMCKCYRTFTGLKMKFMNDGDDCVLICEAEHEQRVRDTCHEFFWGFGMDMSIGTTAHCLEEVEFCQAQPVWLDEAGGYMMIRNVNQCLAKDAGGVVNFQTLKSALRTLHSIGVCGGVLSRGVPVLQVFYRKLRALSKRGVNLTVDSSISASGLLLHARQIARAEFSSALSNLPENMLNKEISSQTRVSFWKAFDITPTDQVLLENRLEEWTLDCTRIYDVGPSHEYEGSRLTRVNWENIPQLL